MTSRKITILFKYRICISYILLSLQCFHKTLGTRRRQWPPSKQEILCTINRRPIYARFHFMDGQFHAIEFDPSATADEVLKLVKSKIGLRENAQGNNLQYKMEFVFTAIILFPISC